MNKTNNSLTDFGVSVKKALLDRGMLQKEFCYSVEIPENRFTEMLYGIRPGRRYRRIITQALGLMEETRLGNPYTFPV
ncbi:hypothetical protein [Paenibacillus psychroresistens]|uniref:hypothetical protein n=1 Tax=Paenibacillus psychroresistens TaxID=1778678 RepID=UPI001D057245|nr:hypothetical protein [Paenibacillus psychroresistens]